MNFALTYQVNGKEFTREFDTEKLLEDFINLSAVAGAKKIDKFSVAKIQHAGVFASITHDVKTAFNAAENSLAAIKATEAKNVEALAIKQTISTTSTTTASSSASTTVKSTASANSSSSTTTNLTTSFTGVASIPKQNEGENAAAYQIRLREYINAQKLNQ